MDSVTSDLFQYREVPRRRSAPFSLRGEACLTCLLSHADVVLSFSAYRNELPIDPGTEKDRVRVVVR